MKKEHSRLIPWTVRSIVGHEGNKMGLTALMAATTSKEAELAARWWLQKEIKPNVPYIVEQAERPDNENGYGVDLGQFEN